MIRHVHRLRTTFAAAIAAIAAVALAACGTDGMLPPATPIDLAVSTSTLTVGDSAQAVATINRAHVSGVRWTSSDTTVVRIDSTGRFGAVSPGWAILTASSPSGRQQGQVAITVRPRPTDGCWFRAVPDLLYLTAGTTADLRDAVVGWCNSGPRGPWRWRAIDTTVATITTEGIVTARRIGTTHLVASSSVSPELQVAVQLTVSAPVCTSGCPLVTPATSVLVPGGTVQLEIAGVTGDSALIREYTFASGSAAVASVSLAGVVRAAAPGTAVIVVTRRADGVVVAQVIVVVRERFSFRATIHSVVRADDGRPVHPDSVTGEIIASVNLERRPDAARTVRLWLVGAAGDSLVATMALPAVTDTIAAVDVVSFRVNTAARDAAGRPRLPNGPHQLRFTFFEGVPAVAIGTLQTQLTLRNAP
jgi:hypothetical protein